METGRRMGSQGEAELGCSSPGFGCCEFGHGLGQTLGDGEGKRSLECCSPWGREELDMTEQLKNNNNSFYIEVNIFPKCTSSHVTLKFFTDLFIRLSPDS